MTDFGAVKDDIVVLDVTGYTKMKVSGDSIKILESNKFYEFSHMKVRRRNGLNVLTTTPSSKISTVTMDDVPVPNVNFFTMQETITVSEIGELGVIDATKKY